MTQEEFKDRVEAFLAAAKMTPTKLGVLALKDPTFVHKLREGRNVSLRVSDRVISFMETYDKVEAAQ